MNYRSRNQHFGYCRKFVAFIRDNFSFGLHIRFFVDFPHAEADVGSWVRVAHKSKNYWR